MPRLIGKTPAPVRLGSPGVWTLQQASDATRDVRWPGVWRNNLLAVISTATPFLQLYGRNTNYGDNNPVPQPAALSFGGNSPQDVAWSMSGGHLAVVANNSNMAWYSHNAGVLTKLSNPASLVGNTVTSCAWSPDDQFLAVSNSTSPFITIFQRSGDTLTKLSNPGTLPTGTANQCAWSPNGEFLAVAHDTSPFITVYQRSGTTFAKINNPVTLPSGGFGCDWSSNDNMLAVGMGASAAIYELLGTTLTRVATTPSMSGVSSAGKCRFSPDGNYLCVGCNQINGGGVFQRTGLTYTLVGPRPKSFPAWSRDGKFLASDATLYSGSAFTWQPALSPAPGGFAVAYSFL